MSQYDMSIVYIPGEDNTVTDALSWMPDGAFPGKSLDNLPHANKPGINAIFLITTDL